MRCTLPVNLRGAADKAVGARSGEHFAPDTAFAFLTSHRLALSGGAGLPSGGACCRLMRCFADGAQFLQCQPPFDDAPPVTGRQSDRQGAPAAR